MYKLNTGLPVDMPGILSCVSDGIIVYKNKTVLFAYAEGHLLLKQHQQTILKKYSLTLKSRLIIKLT